MSVVFDHPDHCGYLCAAGMQTGLQPAGDVPLGGYRCSAGDAGSPALTDLGPTAVLNVDRHTTISGIRWCDLPALQPALIAFGLGLA